ncbi:hypothetical protein CAMRE0001_2524 [Campylobacter rectus RM3267]|uniref:Uncharacterized protein n=1 Tax=Campylobacter rectus RM3267 TaxID=553218 RepID=B9D3R0_CAMRE|nr:hypothetical protein CAMRE0001_2524 [Campylobacter rectus RM3267]
MQLRSRIPKQSQSTSILAASAQLGNSFSIICFLKPIFYQ